jgi:hypothetical protein
MALVILLAVILASAASAGTVRTLDGKVLKGIITIDPQGFLRVDGSAAGASRVDPDDIFSAQFLDKPIDSEMHCGVTLTDGSAVGASAIEKADETGVVLLRGGKVMNLPIDHVARIVFRPVPKRLWDKIPAGKIGALLDNGDFLEGDFKALADGKVTMVSVLFGISDFEIASQILAVNLAEIKPASSNWTIRLTDGTIALAEALKFDSGTLQIQDSQHRPLLATRGQILDIRSGNSRFVALAAIHPDRIEPVDESGFTVDRMPSDLPLRLRDLTPAHCICMAAGGSASWKLDGSYRTFICQAGVACDLAPLVKVRFVVLTDGREVYRSPEKTSVDDPAFITVALSGVHELTLRVQSDVTSDLGAFGLWGDPSMLKKKASR